jgi:hypothetical protein
VCTVAGEDHQTTCHTGCSAYHGPRSSCRRTPRSGASRVGARPEPASRCGTPAGRPGSCGPGLAQETERTAQHRPALVARLQCSRVASSGSESTPARLSTARSHASVNGRPFARARSRLILTSAAAVLREAARPTVYFAALGMPQRQVASATGRLQPTATHPGSKSRGDGKVAESHGTPTPRVSFRLPGVARRTAARGKRRGELGGGRRRAPRAP